MVISKRKLLLWNLVGGIGGVFYCHGVSSFQPSSNHFIPTRQSSKAQLKSQTELFLSSKPSASSKTHVVYQKVVKNSAGNENPLFLGYLVEYLQDRFELPARLPMVYDSVYESTEDNSKEGDKCIQSWDSPMSPSAKATRLDLEVVAIYTDDDEKKNQDQHASIPSMAMVVVRKASAQSSPASVPSPMMLNFFQESEKLILKALDRGLDDFMAGKIPLDDNGSTSRISNRSEQSVEAAQDAMIEEMLEEAASNHPSVIPKDTAHNKPTNKKTGPKVLDAEFSRVPESKKAQGASKHKKSDESDGKDFAVGAAKRLAEGNVHEKKKQAQPVDFAVAAARKLAKAQKTKKKVTNPAKSKKTAPANPKNGATKTQNRAFQTTFSTPEMFIAKQKKQSKSSAETTSAVNNRNGVPEKDATSPPTTNEVETKVKERSRKKAKPDLGALGFSNKAAETKNKQRTTKKAKLNPDGKKKIAQEAKGASVEQKRSSKVRKIKTEPPSKIRKTASAKNGPSDEEIAKTAQKVMAELADQGVDMTAEELLQDVLKFGEQEDRENQVGHGFVTGAFEKAKELLREQKRQHEDRTRRDADAATKGRKPNGSPTGGEPREGGPQVKTRVITSEEEELRRMFEAGERIADGRITLTSEEKTMGASPNANAMGNNDDSEIDELIASDKTVSDHAKVLDDELVELALRINNSPGSELDNGPAGQNPVFDVLSGPEVYNPNVDPETAVNWPGALPGTKLSIESTLPKELAESIKQANFAVEVMQQMEVRDTPDSNVKRYFVGDRELPPHQVEGLQTVINEAVEIGIIRNPLILLEEQALLQMVLDEMWDQPDERLREIVSSYKDLLLSDNFVTLIQERLEAMAERDLESLRQRTDDEDTDAELGKAQARERELLGHLVVNAQLLLKEAKALGAEIEAQHIEIIRSICKVAMDPSHTTEEDTAVALTDAVWDMRPLFDDVFVAYLKYAVAEEEGRLARAGLLDDPEHNEWLFVLKIVQQGVYAEIAKGINRYIDHIWYVLRMETPPERKMLLEKLVEEMPTLDVRPFVRVVDNIVGSLGEASRGDFDGAYELGKMSNKLLQLHRDLKEILPPQRINEMSRDADEWAAKQKERMLQQRRLTKQRLKAARDTEAYDEEIESMGRRGEIERF